MTYWPVERVVTSGDGHFVRTDLCICGEGHEGEDYSCPAHYPEENAGPDLIGEDG